MKLKHKMHGAISRLLGRNLQATPVAVIADQMNEPRPLPMGMAEFETWAARIISGALVSADVESQKFVLANLILHLGPTEDFKEDAFFIHSLRKIAANQIADAKREEIRNKTKARLAAEEASAKKLEVQESGNMTAHLTLAGDRMPKS